MLTSTPRPRSSPAVDALHRGKPAFSGLPRADMKLTNICAHTHLLPSMHSSEKTTIFNFTLGRFLDAPSRIRSQRNIVSHVCHKWCDLVFSDASHMYEETF
ncbi:hypothetical protein B0H13DRAFT_2365743 [Mycena leptocephala]|nr:hypothetical protein B0H13DRAFT_2365743 [Mycena leptocephala]